MVAKHSRVGEGGHRPRALMSWSSGKDSAWALHRLRTEGEVEVVGLLTTFNAEFDRVAMHGVHRRLVEAQARAVGLPMVAVPLPWPCSNEQYEAAMRRKLDEARASLGVTHVAFGDLFLEDIRAYREERMREAGLTPLFPLWGEPTAELARRMIEGGLKAYVVCVDPTHLPATFAGRQFDACLLADLPEGVDPCGEKGEFHTFAYDGPVFSTPVSVCVGRVVEREGFVFADLI
jgi:uncharacterized protein (TIGR00290 family)